MLWQRKADKAADPQPVAAGRRPDPRAGAVPEWVRRAQSRTLPAKDMTA